MEVKSELNVDIVTLGLLSTLLSIDSTIARARDRLWTDKHHPFGRSFLLQLLHRQQKTGGQDRDDERFTFLEGYVLLVCVFVERRAMEKGP